MKPLETQRFLIVTGKGGVGKTTVSAAVALALAAEGKRVLVCMCNSKESMSEMFGSVPIGDEVVSVAKNVWALNINPDKAVEEYGELTLHSKALASILFDNKYTRLFFRAIPGIHEWTMLGKAWWHTTETNESGANVYDVVILDAPATGHGIDMLRVPKIICEVVPGGPMRRDAETAYALFRDPKRCGVLLVTRPEEMPVTEVSELAEVLRKELDLPLASVTVNGALSPIFSSDERVLLSQLVVSDTGDSGDEALLAAKDRTIREAAQAQSVARLRELLPIPTIVLPQIFGAAANRATTDRFAAIFRKGPQPD